MSERTKFFAQKEQHAKAAVEQRDRNAMEKEKASLAFDATVGKAADVYAPHFEKLAQELRDDGIVSIMSRDTKVIEVIDPESRDEYAGHVHLALSFHAGETDFELVYVIVQQPSILGMLAWRRDNASTYYVGPKSKSHPTELLGITDVAEHHINTALNAMQAG